MSKRKYLFERHQTYYETGIPCGNPKRVQTGEVLCMPSGPSSHAATKAAAQMEGIETEGERQLKAMAQKQLRTDITMSQLTSERRQFTGAGQFQPVTKEIRGVMDLQQYQSLADGDHQVEMLRQCGLSEDEIRVKMAADGSVSGMDGINSGKSSFGENPDVRREKLDLIEAKIREKESSLQKPDTFRDVKEISRQEHDLERSLFTGTGRDNTDLSHMLTKQRKEVVGDPNDPINKLPEMMAEIEDKAREKIREKRKAKRRKKRNNQFSSNLPSTQMSGGQIGTELENSTADCEVEEGETTCKVTERTQVGSDSESSDNEVAGCLTHEEALALKGASGYSGTSNSESTVQSDTDRCYLQNPWTVVTSKKSVKSASSAFGISVVKSKDSSDTQTTDSKRKVLREHTEVLPEEYIEEKRLSMEEIKKLPKFENYEVGNPSNVLYLKNLAAHTCEADLVSVFGRYQEDVGSEVVYRLMTGRMRGQAFVTFPNVDSATQALNLVNGFMLHGKPVIIQYGRRTTT